MKQTTKFFGIGNLTVSCLTFSVTGDVETASLFALWGIAFFLMALIPED